MNSGNDAIYKTNMRGQQRAMVKLVDSHIYSTLLRRAQLLLLLSLLLLLLLLLLIIIILEYFFVIASKI